MKYDIKYDGGFSNLFAYCHFNYLISGIMYIFVLLLETEDSRTRREGGGKRAISSSANSEQKQQIKG